MEGSSDGEEVGSENKCQALVDGCERKRHAWSNKEVPIVVTQGLGDGTQGLYCGFNWGMPWEACENFQRGVLTLVQANITRSWLWQSSLDFSLALLPSLPHCGHALVHTGTA